MANYEFIKSSKNYPQNGTFETFSVKFNGEDLFYWSDNYGFDCRHEKQEIAYDHLEVYSIYLAMEAAQIASQEAWRIANKGKHDNYNTVYAREGRTDEFGVNWTEL